MIRHGFRQALLQDGFPEGDHLLAVHGDGGQGGEVRAGGDDDIFGLQGFGLSVRVRDFECYWR